MTVRVSKGGTDKASAVPSLEPSTDISDDRDKTADDRDATSERQADTADARDQRSAERDERAELRDELAGRIDLDSAADRIGARRDREAAAADRGNARDDRHAAASDRALSSSERAELLVDELTGAYLRAAGFLELEREIIKAERTDQPFVLAFLDVDGLKELNDIRGHAEGDELLRLVVDVVRDRLREYDVVVRFGGDEFVCGLPDMRLDEVRERLEGVNAALQEAKGASITFGLAEREPGEALGPVIERADAAMYLARKARG